MECGARDRNHLLSGPQCLAAPPLVLGSLLRATSLLMFMQSWGRNLMVVRVAYGYSTRLSAKDPLIQVVTTVQF